jgi:hypothetical protein
MNKDDFLETLRERYAEEIHEAYLACEHDGGKVVDNTKLFEMLHKLQANAVVDGLPKSEFRDLAKSTLPGVDIELEQAA